MDLGNTSIKRLLWHYSLPSLIGTLANALYNVVDRIYIGQGVGALAISGMAITFPIMNILGAFGMLVGQGAAARVSLYLGNSNTDKANTILSNTVILTIVTYLVVSSLCLVFLDPILTAFGGSPHTIPYAREYMQIIIPGHIFTSLSYAFTNIMRASGHPRYAMYTLLIGAVLNVVIDPIFIFALDMGIQGAAWATVISMCVSMIWVMRFYFRKEHTLHFSRSTFKVDLPSIAAILSIGLSPFLLNVSTSLVNLLMNHTLLAYGGDLAIGAFGIITSFTTLVVMSIVGLSQGMQPIIGYNYGAGNYLRVKEALRLCIIVATAITSIGWLVGLVAPGAIARCFTSDSELTAITAYGLRIYICTFFVVGFHIVATNYFQSIGKAWISIVLSLSRQILLLIPFIIILPPLFGLNGAWMAQPASNIIAAVIAAICIKYHTREQASKTYTPVE